MFVLCELQHADLETIREKWKMVSIQLMFEYPSFLLLKVTLKKPSKQSALNLEEMFVESPYQVTDELPILVNGNSVDVENNRFEYSGHPRTLLKFAGPIHRQWLRLLKQYHLVIHFFCPPFGLCVEFNRHRNQTIRQLRQELPTLIGATPYLANYCSRPIASNSKSMTLRAGILKNWVDLVLFRQEQKQMLKAKVKKCGATLISESRYKLRLAFDKSLDTLRAIAGVKLVNHTRPSIVATTELKQALGMSGQDYAAFALELTGKGQIVAVADTGFDRGTYHTSIHPDFEGRVKEISSWPINESWDSYVKHPKHNDGAADTHSGHGTHVAGLALGSGKASDGHYQGIAPGAELVFQAIEQYTEITPAMQSQIPTGYYLSGRPVDLRELFLEARELGARLHVNAWGDPVSGSYTDDCYEADDFLFKHKDSVILFAAGNEGADKNGDRLIDSQSLYAPASSKNVIAIGATEGPRQGVGLRQSWSVFDSDRQKRFTHRDDRNDAISGQPEHIALISSTGPTKDGRIKPDLCAPGTNLAAARSQAANVRGWGLASPLPYYMYYGGTSMSTGVAGGYFALLRQSWQQYANGAAPSGPALKALAILSAKPVYKRDSEDSESKFEPRNVAGFGRIDLENALPLLKNQIRLIDHRDVGLSTGEQHVFPIRLNKSQPFRAVLTWYDAPGEGLINNLNLSLMQQGKVLYWGNHSDSKPGARDLVNNVEVIEPTELPEGDYVLRVQAFNVPVGQQTYALVFNAPHAAKINIPLLWIKGIGKVYSGRLRKNGIQNFENLIQLSLTQLSQILKKKGRSTQRLMARILLIEEKLKLTLPVSLPNRLSLDDFLDSKPDDVELSLWEETQKKLLPLIEVFDKSKLNKIKLSDFFVLQA